MNAHYQVGAQLLCLDQCFHVPDVQDIKAAVKINHNVLCGRCSVPLAELLNTPGCVDELNFLVFYLTQVLLDLPRVLFLSELRQLHVPGQHPLLAAALSDFFHFYAGLVLCHQQQPANNVRC